MRAILMEQVFAFVPFFFFSLTAAGTDTGIDGGERTWKNQEERLVDDLLLRYNKDIRPSVTHDDVTEVFIELSLFDILELDTKNHMLKINSEFIMKWHDPQLQWDPFEYGNFTSINLPYKDIWFPDILLYNTASTDYWAGILNTNAIIRHNGNVELVSHAIFESICKINIEWYPFDEQTCELTFASWTFDEEEIHLVLGPSDLSEYTDSPEYLLENFRADHYRLFNPCCHYPMSAIVYFVQLQRRRNFALFFCVMPGILINICAVLVFSLPAESGEKIVLGISSMLAMIVFLMEMTFRLPPTEDLPLVGVYYGVCLAIIAVNILLSVAIMNLNVAGERKRRIPSWFKSTILTFVKLLKNKIPDVVAEKWGVVKDHKGNIWWDSSNFQEYQEAFVRVRPIMHQDEAKVYPNDAEYKFKTSFEKRMTRALETIASAMDAEDEDEEQSVEDKTLVAEWKFISIVMDRFLFYSFMVFIVAVNAYLLISSPYGEYFLYCPTEKSVCEGLSRTEILSLAYSGVGHEISEDSAIGSQSH